MAHARLPAALLLASLLPGLARAQAQTQVDQAARDAVGWVFAILGVVVLAAGLAAWFLYLRLDHHA